MSEIFKTFYKLKARGEGGLIAFVTAGDPDPSYTPKIVNSLIQGGADIIELGIPFSDPIADGPIIQAASMRSLKAGTTVKKVFDMIGNIKEKNKIPIVILTYYNPIYRMGLKKFFEIGKTNGVDGVIVPDLPIEEAFEYKKYANNFEIDTIFLAAPSTSDERLKKILGITSGFLYLVSVYGITGTRKKIEKYTLDFLNKTLKNTSARIPLAVGFGISSMEHVRIVIENGANAAIVGSKFVKIIEKKHGNEEELLNILKECVKKLKKATLNTAI